MTSLNPLVLWRRFLALPNESRAKTLGVAVLVALVCATGVSVTTVALRPLQEQNTERIRQERLASVLARAPGLGSILEHAGAVALETRTVVLATGAFTADALPAEFDAGAAATDPSQSVAIPPEADIAGIRRRSNLAEVHLFMPNGEIALVVLPVYGSGYQSTIYAYLALEADLATVAAFSVYEQGETPGLGARIQDAAWQDLWPGKEITDETGAIRIAVVKGQGAGPHEVDGITGATRTSSAVSNMLRFWLGDWGYGPFLAKLRSSLNEGEPPSPPAVPAVEGPAPAVVPGGPAAVPPAVLPLLAEIHSSSGITCLACHGDGIPAAGVAVAPDASTAMCLGCHGSFTAVAARTAATLPNPHASHLGDLACSSCHRAHQPSVDYCGQCHSFGFQVP